MNAHDTILRTEELSVGYGENVILSGLDLFLKKGELVCLIGPNGAGKSTLLRTLSNVQDALSGLVFINEKEIKKYNGPELARMISLVLTDRMASGNLTVYELVGIGRYPHTDWTGRMNPADEEKVWNALNDTHIAPLADQKVYKLSDGQRQKTMIARALAQDCGLMILDEPSSHLDVGARVEIMKLLQNLAHEGGKSILAATHELDLAMQTADKLWVAGADGSFAAGVPEDLALKGVIRKSLRMENFDFDPATGKIVIRPRGKRRVKLSGRGQALFWTRHALERRGFAVTDDAPEEVRVSDGRWTWLRGENIENFNSIENLLDALQ